MLIKKSHQNAGESELPTQGCSVWQTLVPKARCTTVSRDVTLYTVPNAPEPSTLIFLNSVSFKILKRAWFGASPLGVSGSTSCEEGSRPGLSALPSTICDMYGRCIQGKSSQLLTACSQALLQSTQHKCSKGAMPTFSSEHSNLQEKPTSSDAGV